MATKEQIIKKLKNLPQNKNKTQEEMEVLADEELKKKEIISSTFAATPEEEKFAKELLNKYMSQGSIETETDKEGLRQLIGQEIIAERFNNLLKIQYSAANPAQDMYMVKQLDEVVERISILKKELGLTQSDRQSATWLAEWDKLKRKALAYYQEHKGCNVVKCIAEDTQILMSDFSTKNIQDVKIGDKIISFDENGLNRVKIGTVLNKTFSGIKTVVKIKDKYNKELELTPDHRILTNNSHSERRWQEVGNEIIGKTLSSRHGITSLKYLINNYINYYKGCLLGIIDSDGNISKPKHKKWNFSTRYTIWQSETTEYKFIDFILNILNIKHSKKSEHSGRSGFNKEYKGFCYHISTKSNNIIEDSRDEIYIDKDIMLGYIVGFIIGDGSITDKGQLRIHQRPGIKSDYLENILNILKIRFIKTVGKKSKMNLFSIKNFEIPFYAPNSKKAEKYQQVLHSDCRTFEYNIFELIGIRKDARVWDLTTTTGTFIANGFFVHNCPYCSKIFYLLLKTEHLTSETCAWFKGTALYNKPLMQMVEKNQITRQDAADVLGVNILYVDKVYENIYLKEKTNEKS